MLLFPIYGDVETKTNLLIKKLKEIEAPNIGLSGTSSGHGFLPLNLYHFSVGRLGVNHNFQDNPALTDLVALGPEALPILFKHLDDKTETKLFFEHHGGFGGMWYGEELYGGNKHEEAIIAKYKLGVKSGFGNNINSHRVTVGDVCFVAIGMILNRGYNAIRYQPTACKVINSPTSSPNITKALREIWKGKLTPEEVFKSLEADLKNGSYSAATRLLYYFKEDAVTSVLSQLKVSINQKWIEATAWCEFPEIRKALQDHILKSNDPYEVINGLPAILEDPDGKFLNKIKETLEFIRSEEWNTGWSSQLLLAIKKQNPKTWKDIWKWYIKDSDEYSHNAIIYATYSLNPKDVPIEIISYILKDKRTGYGQYIINGEGVHEVLDSKHYKNYRLKDNVYELISRSLDDKDTVAVGKYEEMDARIEKLLIRLKQPKEKWPFSKEEIQARTLDRNRVKIKKEKADKLLGESGRLIKYVFPEDQKDEWLDKKRLAKIAKDYPENLLLVYNKILNDKTYMHSHPVIELMIKKLPKDKFIHLLRKGASHKLMEHRRAALFALLDLKSPDLPNLLIKALDDTPVTPVEKYWSAPEGAFAIIVGRINHEKAWEALIRNSKRVDTGLRLEWLKRMRYGNASTKANFDQRLNYLRIFLKDKTIHDGRKNKEKNSGPSASSQLNSPFPISDFAYVELGYFLKVKMPKGPSTKWSKEQMTEIRKSVNNKLIDYHFK